LVFWWRCWVLAHSFHSSWVVWLWFLLFLFFNISFIFELWVSFFHLL
jgi:hypothetical protein